MAHLTHALDLFSLDIPHGGARSLTLALPLEPLSFGGERYEPDPARVDARLDVTAMTGGYALRLRFSARLSGACMRCLEPAAPQIAVDAREVSLPDRDDEDLRSPYVAGSELDAAAWARDALALALPPRILCRDDCAGLCPQCGTNLNSAGPDHAHERAPDPRWAKLRELRLPR